MNATIRKDAITQLDCYAVGFGAACARKTEARTQMSLTDRLLLIVGAVCHLVGMPLAEWVDVRWFCLVLAGETMWLAYARTDRERR